MSKIVCFLLLLVSIVAGAKIGQLIDPISVDGESLPLFGMFFTNLYAKIAREIVHNSNDTLLATVSTTKPLKGYPMVDTIDVADSKWNASSTGDINFYLQKSDPLFVNLKKKNAVSVIFSNETTKYNNETEQVDTVGYRVLVTGSVAQIPPNTTMYNDTMDVLVDRHPDAVPVLGRLNTILCKIEIDQICVIDKVNGPFCLTDADYYNADVDE